MFFTFRFIIGMGFEGEDMSSTIEYLNQNMNDLGTSYMLLNQKTAESLRAFSIENGQLLHTDYITLREGYTNLIDYANQLYQTYIYPATTGIL